MAPVCRRCCQPALLRSVFVVVLFLFQDISALLIYTRQIILDMRASHQAVLNNYMGDRTSNPTPPLLFTPAYLRRKRFRRQEMRASALVRLLEGYRNIYSERHASPRNKSLPIILPVAPSRHFYLLEEGPHLRLHFLCHRVDLGNLETNN